MFDEFIELHRDAALATEPSPCLEDVAPAWSTAPPRTVANWEGAAPPLPATALATIRMTP